MSDRLALGLDLGGTQVRAALVDEAGTILSRAAALTDVAGGPGAILAQFDRLVAAVLGGRDRRALAGAGVSAPGPLDSEAGIVLGIPTLPGWEEFPLRAALARRLGVPVVLENDGIAAANGEWRFGAGQGLRHLVYVTVSTGIGGGAVVDGRLLRGRRGLAGHVGHSRLSLDGPLCSCGTRGCFEAHASGPALAAAAVAAIAHGHDSALARVPGPLTAAHVAAAARAGDAVARSLLQDESRWLGLGFTTLIHLFSPERLIMGGGVSQAFDLLEDGISAVVRATALPAFRDVPVVRAALGENSGLIGAAALALHPGAM